MPITSAQLRSAKPAAKAYKLFDGGGLYLRVGPTGSMVWKYKLRAGGNETTVTLGDYPAMGLKDARESRDRIRLAARAGELVRRGAPAGPPKMLFREAAEMWLDRQASVWKPAHHAYVRKTLEAEVFPVFGDRPLDEIEAWEVADFLTGVQARGVHDHAHDLRQRIKNIFRYAQSRGVIDRNPAENMEAVMKPIPKATHRAALVALEDVLAMISSVESTSAHPIVKAAFRLSLLTALRQGEVRFGLWSEIHGLDGNSPIWIIPGHRMKGKIATEPPPHKVPLSRQAAELLRALKPLTYESGLLFPAFQQGHGSISENAVNLLIGRAGFKGRQTAHGLRSCFSSIMKKRNRADSYIIELMLAHTPDDEVAKAYDREEYLDERRALFQVWADIVLAGAPPASALLSRPRRLGNGRKKIRLADLQETG